MLRSLIYATAAVLAAGMPASALAQAGMDACQPYGAGVTYPCRAYHTTVRSPQEHLAQEQALRGPRWRGQRIITGRTPPMKRDVRPHGPNRRIDPNGRVLPRRDHLPDGQVLRRLLRAFEGR